MLLSPSFTVDKSLSFSYKIWVALSWQLETNKSIYSLQSAVCDHDLNTSSLLERISLPKAITGSWRWEE